MLLFDDVTLRVGEFSMAADLTVADGHVTAVVGPSGGGKSTLLNAVAGFVTPTSGRLSWRGAPLDGLPPGDRPLAMLFQDQNLFPHLTVAQNVGLGLAPSLKLSLEQRNMVDETLTSVGLAGMGSRRPAELSGGQQGRAALARVLVGSAPLVLMDEPFSALGPGLRAEMLDLVADRLRGRCVLLVTHSPEDADRIAAHTIVVADGRAHPPQDTAALLADPTEALRRYIGD